MKQVRDYIHKDISCVSENASLRRVINTMKLHRVSALPVVNKYGEYRGCISEQDILNAAVPAYMKKMHDTSFMAGIDQITVHLKNKLNHQVIDFVNENYPSVSPNDSVSYAADLLYRINGTILPVVEEKTLIGLLTRIEILSASIDTR